MHHLLLLQNKISYLILRYCISTVVGGTGIDTQDTQLNIWVVKTLNMQF